MSSIMLRTTVSVRARVKSAMNLIRNKSVEAYPYQGNPNGFKQIDANTVEVTEPPSDMPYFELSNGVQVPGIGMGTFTGTRNTQMAQAGTMYETTKMWLRVGGRGIDAASNYLNEQEIGDAIEDCINEGFVKRDDIFVSSKLNNPYHRPEHVRPMLEKTLLDLKMDQVDMYLMHWPTAFVYVPYEQNKRGFPIEYEPDHCSQVTGTLWSKDGVSYVPQFKQNWPPAHLDMGVTNIETWQAMVECYEAGLTRGIGVCNFKVGMLHEFLCGTDTKPHIVQCEGHPYCQQNALIEFCNMNDLQFQAYSPLGYGLMADPKEPKVLENPVLGKIGEKHGKSIAAVVLRWHMQRGVPVPPASLKEDELRQNLLVGGWALDQDDMDTIATLDKNHHYLRPDEWYGLHLWD